MIAFLVLQVVVLAQLGHAGWRMAPRQNSVRPFGVLLSPRPGGPLDVAAAARTFRLRIGLAGGLVTVAAPVLSLATGASALQIATATIAWASVLFLFGVYAYARARHRLSVAISSDTDIRWTGGLPRRWVLAVAGAPVLTGLVGAARYTHLPSMLAAGWTAGGHPDRYVATTPDTVTGFVALQVLLALVTVVLAGGVAEASGGAGRQVLATALGAQLAISAASLIVWGLLPPTGFGSAVVAVPVAVVILAGLFGKVSRRRRPPEATGPHRWCADGAATR